MSTLGSCETWVSRSIKRVFQLLLKDAFSSRFGYNGPRHTLLFRDLAFLPHVIQTDLPWRRIRLELVRSFLDIDSRRWGHCLHAPHSLDRSSARLVDIGNALLNYRLSIQQTVPTRMKVLYSWNLDNWHAPKQPKRDVRMQKCKRLLAKGPICLQETKWSASEKEVLLQHIPGLQIAESLATPTPGGHWSGGVAVLVPPGYVLKDSHNLVPGRAVAALIADRTSQYYIVSVYLHPDRVRQDLAALCQALQGLTGPDSRIILAGDFNRADERCVEAWDSFLEDFHVYDVFPSLGTFRHPRGLSPLDRCLVPNDWVSSARWNPSLSAIEPRGAQGHLILKMQVRLKPCVLNSPSDPKHATIPSNTFMPGKDGSTPRDISSLYGLVRLLHRQHNELFAGIPRRDGFVLQDPHSYNDCDPSPGYVIPDRSDDYCIPPLPCDLQVGELAPSRRHMSTSLAASNGPVGEDDNPYSNVAINEASVLVEALQNHTRTSSMLPNLTNAYLSIASCFWSWWRSMPSEQSLSTKFPYLKARKYLHITDQWVNVAPDVLQDLILHSKGAVISTLDSLPVVNGAVSVPRSSIQEMFTVIDDYIAGIPYLPCDPVDTQARGFGNMVAFWERMRNICPKVNIYNGPILREDGSQCRTALDLDEAMLATRKFWFEKPVEQDERWANVLRVYATSDMWPEVPLPCKKDLLHTLLHTKDSAPGPDGLPYSAWRLLPEVTVDAMISYFMDIMEDTALPPMQVGVWIPKAKMGPEADNFRPLGMPNTLDRLVDGTIASVVMKAVAPNMHPSQTVMSMFKEPARAVTAIQSFLDSSKASCALLADLSKAFERVNPYWILALLRSKGAPAWVIRYSRFVLFERRVTHKVQGRLLPSRVIRQGVDMGRSFSVFLFCFAMDPLFHYLNRIPQVMSVQAYVDDTTLVGDAQDLRWIQNVAQCYDDVRTAGFVVDSHSCYRSISNCTMRFGPTLMTSARLLQEWPAIMSSPAYATATAAIQAALRPGYNTLVVRITRWPLTPLPVEPEDPSKQHLAINLNFEQCREVGHGRQMHTIGSFSNIHCSCKSKSHIVTNFPMRPYALSGIEKAGYGVHAATASAPALGLTLFGRTAFDEQGEWAECSPPTSLRESKPAPFQKFQQRLRSFSTPTLSIIARSTCFNTYILSVMPYTASYFGLSSTDLNYLRQQAVKFILGRHWIEAEIFPYILRYLGISVLLDPALSATVAATGLYFREGNKYEDLWIEHSDSSGCNLRQKAIVRDLLQLWIPYIQLSDIAASLTAHKNGVTGRLDRLKRVIITGMVLAAKTQLRKKILREGWSQGISVDWVDLIADAPKKWCNGIARFTLLRWAVNQDDDVWLTLRGTRHKHLCGVCLRPGDTFPGGFYTEAMCEHCIAAHGITPLQHCPFGLQLQEALGAYYGLRSTGPERAIDPPETLMAPFRSTFPTNGTVCAACGCGDNTIGHWSRWCIIPLLVAWILTQPGHSWATLNDIAVNSRRTATICTLVLAAFRRLLRQEGAFVHQVRGEPKSVAWWCDTLIESTCQDATKELGVPLMHPRLNRAQCLLHAQLIDTVRVLPTDIATMHLPPVVNISIQNGKAGDRLGVIAVDSIHNAVFREMSYAPPERRKNVSLEYMHCQCGDYHVHVTLTEHVMSGDILTPCSFGPPKIFCQFDGSAHRAKTIGGAGAAMYVLSEQGLQLLDWSCLSIPKCPDNIVAEVLGADLSLRLYERYVHGCLSHNIVPLPLDRIQGDIQPLLSHLRFQTRFRRPDLVAVINRFHVKRSRLAPSSATEYRPREANFVADYLAGRGSAFLLHNTEAGAAFQGIIEHDIDPPYELLLQHNASIFGKHAAGKTILVLREASACSALALSCVVPQVDEHTQRLLCDLALATQKFSRRHVVEYVAAATDGQGRLYAKQSCAQYLPKPVRAFIYAQTHQEVDMAGAHYELIRRFVNSSSLPHIEVLRTALAAIWGEDCCIGSENIIKMFPVRVIHAGAPATLRFLQQHCLQVAGVVSTVAFDLDAAKVVCADAALRHRAELVTTYTNRYFYACEYLEMQVMSRFVKAIQMRYRCASIIWLHDGVWLDVVVSTADIAKAEQEAVEEVFPNSTHTERLFRTRSLATDYSQAVELFSNTPTTTYIFPSHPVPLPLRTSRKKPAAIFHDRRHHSEHDEVYHERMRKRTRRH